MNGFSWTLQKITHVGGAICNPVAARQSRAPITAKNEAPMLVVSNAALPGAMFNSQRASGKQVIFLVAGGSGAI